MIKAVTAKTSGNDTTILINTSGKNDISGDSPHSYANLTLADLKEIAKSRNLSQRGRKSELVRFLCFRCICLFYRISTALHFYLCYLIIAHRVCVEF